MGEIDQRVLARSLQYYKRREAQEAILRHATDREISPRYGEGFGKRPDTLSYPTDVLEFAKRKCTSFHCSEERWSNPLHIKTGGTRKELNDLRIGWDLVLDIDAKDWDLSRLTAWLFIESLKAHGVRESISVKFSGNKGWHIGVPWEAFPRTIMDAGGKDLHVKDLFPDMPRAIAGYLLDFMGRAENGLIMIEDDTVTFGWNDRARKEPWMSPIKKSYSLKALAAIAGKQPGELLETFCPSCAKPVSTVEISYALCCPKCGHRGQEKYTRDEKSSVGDNALVCPKCKGIMEFTSLSKDRSCPHGASGYLRRFKLTDVIEVDTILLASRHLYRMAYSLHEKSGLASVIIDTDHVLEFDKKEADPSTITFDRDFIMGGVPLEAERLANTAWTWQERRETAANAGRPQRTFDEMTEQVGEEHFPPCIKSILGGLTDGKKRAMFALTNFFIVCGWTPDQIEARLHQWNEQNGKVGEPLREVIIKGHMHGVKQKKERILPPNCKSFYQELGVCKPEEFCSMARNPAQFAIKHVQLGANRKKAKKKDEKEKDAVSIDKRENAAE